MCGPPGGGHCPVASRDTNEGSSVDDIDDIVGPGVSERIHEAIIVPTFRVWICRRGVSHRQQLKNLSGVVCYVRFSTAATSQPT